MQKSIFIFLKLKSIVFDKVKKFLLKMRQQKYLYFLIIFCSISSQGIETLAEENIEDSSDLHVRMKRLIDKTPHGNKPVTLKEVNYIVNIEKNYVSRCAGSILTAHIILTAAHCFRNTAGIIHERVLAGSSSRYHGTSHRIVSKIFHPHFNPKVVSIDIVLLVVYPPIDLVHSYNRPIGLYKSTKVPPNSIGTFSGWGCTRVIGNKKEFPNELRSINVPIIKEEECQRLYNDFATITNENICTLDEKGKQSSCFGDSGAPLVVGGYLIGVMSWRKEGKLTPDVFVNVAHPNIRPWILSFITKFKT